MVGLVLWIQIFLYFLLFCFKKDKEKILYIISFLLFIIYIFILYQMYSLTDVKFHFYNFTIIFNESIAAKVHFLEKTINLTWYTFQTFTVFEPSVYKDLLDLINQRVGFLYVVSRPEITWFDIHTRGEIYDILRNEFLKGLMEKKINLPPFDQAVGVNHSLVGYSYPYLTP